MRGVDGIYLTWEYPPISWIRLPEDLPYREDAPLDMRMDQRNDVTAAHIINTYSEMELYRIIRDYGEDTLQRT